LESAHPYRDNHDETIHLSIPGAKSITITFDSQTVTERSHDWVKFYKKKVDGSLQGQFGSDKYSGGSSNWPGNGSTAPLVVEGEECYIKWRTDGSGNDWGWKLTATATAIPAQDDSVHWLQITTRSISSLTEAIVPKLFEFPRWDPSEELTMERFLHQQLFFAGRSADAGNDGADGAAAATIANTLLPPMISRQDSTDELVQEASTRQLVFLDELIEQTPRSAATALDTKMRAHIRRFLMQHGLVENVDTETAGSTAKAKAVLATVACMLWHNSLVALAIKEANAETFSPSLVKVWQQATKEILPFFKFGDLKHEEERQQQIDESPNDDDFLARPRLQRLPSVNEFAEDNAVVQTSDALVARARFLLKYEPASFDTQLVHLRWQKSLKFAKRMSSRAVMTSDAPGGALVDVVNEATAAKFETKTKHEMVDLASFKLALQQKSQLRRALGKTAGRKVIGTTISECIVQFLQANVDTVELEAASKTRDLRAMHRIKCLELLLLMLQVDAGLVAKAKALRLVMRIVGQHAHSHVEGCLATLQQRLRQAHRSVLQACVDTLAGVDSRMLVSHTDVCTELNLSNPSLADVGVCALQALAFEFQENDHGMLAELQLLSTLRVLLQHKASTKTRAAAWQLFEFFLHRSMRTTNMLSAGDDVQIATSDFSQQLAQMLIDMFTSSIDALQASQTASTSGDLSPHHTAKLLPSAICLKLPQKQAAVEGAVQQALGVYNLVDGKTLNGRAVWRNDEEVAGGTSTTTSKILYYSTEGAGGAKEAWACPQCTLVNNAADTECSACGELRLQSGAKSGGGGGGGAAAAPMAPAFGAPVGTINSDGRVGQRGYWYVGDNLAGNGEELEPSTLILRVAGVVDTPDKLKGAGEDWEVWKDGAWVKGPTLDCLAAGPMSVDSALQQFTHLASLLWHCGSNVVWARAIARSTVPTRLLELVQQDDSLTASSYSNVPFMQVLALRLLPTILPNQEKADQEQLVDFFGSTLSLVGQSLAFTNNATPNADYQAILHQRLLCLRQLTRQEASMDSLVGVLCESMDQLPTLIAALQRRLPGEVGEDKESKEPFSAQQLRGIGALSLLGGYLEAICTGSRALCTVPGGARKELCTVVSCITNEAALASQQKYMTEWCAGSDGSTKGQIALHDAPANCHASMSPGDGTGQCIRAAAPLPETGTHYFEVKFTRGSRSQGESLGCCYLCGVVNRTSVLGMDKNALEVRGLALVCTGRCVVCGTGRCTVSG
jgi:hypothetical protein